MSAFTGADCVKKRAWCGNKESITQENINEICDILLSIDNYQRHPLLKPWYDDLDKCISETQPVPREMDETQLDYRKSAK